MGGRRWLAGLATALVVLGLGGGAAAAYPALTAAPPTTATFHPPATPVARPLALPSVSTSGSLAPTPSTSPSSPARPSGGASAKPSRAGAATAPRPRYQVQVIGHRGAPAYRPAHTLEGYQLALDQGADFVEPDLVMTMDGHLIARHESDLTDSTDVRSRPELAGRARNGRWFAEHLTLAEVKTLRAVGGPKAHSGRYAIPTLEEVVALVKRQPRRVGLYAELKVPGHLRSLGLKPEERLAAVLVGAGWRDRSAPVFVQSFEADSLRRVRQLVDVRLTQLVWGDASAGPIRPGTLEATARYADAIGVDRDRLRPYLGAPPAADNLVEQARRHGLAVHVYTLGARNPYPSAPAGFAHPADPAAWSGVIPIYRAYYALGVAAVFTDAPDIAVYARG